MAQFLITYLGGDKPSSEEEGRRNFEVYQQGLLGLGDAVVEPMVPFKNIHVIHSDGSVSEGSSVAMSGHTIVEANSIEEAVAVAQGCPFLKTNGSLEVAEVMNMAGA